MKILFTAFKGTHNTSFQLVDAMACDAILLTNSFQGLKRDILSIDGDYDTVYMFGVDKNLMDKVRVETCASYDGESVSTAFDISSLEKKLRNSNISYTVSNISTHYLCNAAYFHMLQKNANTVFVHIPSAKGMSAGLMDKLVAIFG